MDVYRREEHGKNPNRLAREDQERSRYLNENVYLTTVRSHECAVILIQSENKNVVCSSSKHMDGQDLQLC